MRILQRGAYRLQCLGKNGPSEFPFDAELNDCARIERQFAALVSHRFPGFRKRRDHRNCGLAKELRNTDVMRERLDESAVNFAIRGDKPALISDGLILARFRGVAVIRTCSALFRLLSQSLRNCFSPVS